ncbi:MAG: hypothetical protein QY309_09930 [Cyclobacteriaceae bacterium]|nr:MAG: hypothetical protein QY309_09930 [Cyclobacteriaceae bacterium]
MKTTSFFKKALTLVAIVSLGAVISCTEDDLALQQEAADVAEDAITDYFFEDADDMTGLVMVADNGSYEYEGGRIASSRTIQIQGDSRICNGVTITVTIDEGSTNENPSGTITIDFGDGCQDVLGNVRKGKIIITFSGKKFLPGSTIVTTFDGYSINDIQLSGIRTLTNITDSNVSAPKFRVELENGKAIWPDATEATREHCFVRTWQRGGNPSLDAMVVDKCTNNDSWPHDYTAAGENRRGRAYTMTILEPLVYKRGCPIAVEGVKQFVDVATGKVVTVDYGDGACDRIITISVDGNSRSVNVGRRG